MYFDFNSTYIYLQGSICQFVHISSGNDLAPNRCQAITWTNVDQDVGHNELKHNKPNTFINRKKNLFSVLNMEIIYSDYVNIKQKMQQSLEIWHIFTKYLPDSKVHGANMGPIWVRQDPGGPHVGPMNFAIWVIIW